MVARKKQAPAEIILDTEDEPAHVLIIEARFYEDLADKLADGAIAVLEANGVTYERVSVLGCLEIPAALAIALDAMVEGEGIFYDGFVVLGTVVRGDTSHYDIVINESNRKVMDLMVQGTLALGNGILTVENEEQALERADPKKLDKGGFAARACLTMIALKRRFEEAGED